MKRTRFIVFILLSCGFLFGAAAQEVKFAIGEWAPYTGEKMAGNGLATELVVAACQAAGLKPVFQWVPWKRAEAYVDDGSQFATFPYLEIKERQGKYLFSDPLFSSGFGILYNNTSAKTKDFKYADAASFKGMTVGFTSGTDAVRLPLEKAGAKTDESAAPDVAVSKLDLGRVDFVIDDQAVLFAAIKGLGAKIKAANLVFLGKPFGDVSTFKVMVSLKYPDSANLLKSFNAGLAKIRANGTYATIMAKYGLSAK